MVLNEIVTKGDLRSIIERLEAIETSLNKPPLNPPQLLTQKQAANVLCLSVNTVRRLTRKGVIPCVTIGDSIIRYSRQELESLILSGPPLKYNKG